MCDKPVDSYSHALEFIPECYKNPNICDKALDTCPSTTKYVTD